MKKLTLSIFLALSLLVVKTNANPCIHIIHATDSSLQNNSYFVFNKSKNIDEVKIRKSKKSGSIIYITVGIPKRTTTDNNITAMGIGGKSESKDLRNETGPIFDHIDVLNGGYDDIKVEKLNSSQNVYTIKNVNFPLRLKVKAGSEQAEFEIKEVGRWDVDINYKNN